MLSFKPLQTFNHTREIFEKKLKRISPHQSPCVRNTTYLPNISSTPLFRDRLTAAASRPDEGKNSTVAHHDHDLVKELMPKHVAMLPDGNRRWATSRMLPHQAAYEIFPECTKQLALNCSKLGIQVLTVFPFSTENWSRPKDDIDMFMGILEGMIRTDFLELACQGLQVSVIGERSRLPPSLQSAISNMEDLTKENKGMRLLVALNYGGRYDIIQSCKKIASKVSEGVLSVEDINEDLFHQNLLTSDVEYPNIDLVIRAGGEFRLSNFMVWQSAFSELYFSNKFFPDFDEADLLLAIKTFQKRDRRYGGKPKTSDSIPNAICS